MSKNSYGGGDPGDIGCIITILLAIIAMPLVGLYLIFREPDSLALGLILFTFGLVWWGVLIYISIMMNYT